MKNGHCLLSVGFPIRNLKITLVDDNNEKFCKFVGTLFLLSNSQKLMPGEIEVIFERHFILESRSIAGYVTERENENGQKERDFSGKIQRVTLYLLIFKSYLL